MPDTTTVIVGAGHCGLAMSRCLAARSVDHVVLERGQVANSWRTQRWDSLRLLTPNWMTRLPGYAYRGADPDGYLSAGQVAAMLADYAGASAAPVLTGVTVTSVRAAAGGYVVRTDRGTWRAPTVVLARAIEEILRWDAPVPHSTFRYTTRDVVLGGTVIPAFAQVIISLAAANRDPDRYENACTFDTARADTSHLAFGHGIHHCLGARLARLEAVIAFTTLHRRFPAMRLAVPPSALRWGHGDGLVLRGLTELPVILSP